MLQQQNDIMMCVAESYLDKELDPLKRIENIWYVTFFLRYWRKRILQNPNYTLKNNFVTENACMCIDSCHYHSGNYSS